MELGLAIKKGSPFPVTFVVTNCNGTAGYLPTARQHAEGGYEVEIAHLFYCNFRPKAGGWAEVTLKFAPAKGMAADAITFSLPDGSEFVIDEEKIEKKERKAKTGPFTGPAARAAAPFWSIADEH